MASDIAKCIIENKGKDLAIVLDGYDEMPEKDRTHSFVADIISRQILPNCLLVITSRSTASLHLRNNVDCRVEIVGFTEEDRLHYIKSALPDSYETVRDIQLFLRSNPTINALCYIPLNMTILLCLAENGISDLPKTQTEMYGKFIKMTIVRFLQKESPYCVINITNLFQLPSPHNVVFIELARFAFTSLQCDKLVFTLDEMSRMCPTLTITPNNWNGLGLLNSITSFDHDKTVTYNFLHFSIQEYMAACHISMLSRGEQIKCLQKSYWTIRYYNTWIMYVGITGGESFALRHFFAGNWFISSTILFKSFKISSKFLKDKIKRLHVFQCLFETKNDALISSMGNLFQKEIDLSNQTLLPNDLDTLGFFLIRSLKILK